MPMRSILLSPSAKVYPIYHAWRKVQRPMRNTITSEILVAYSQCSRKAFLLLCTDEQGIPHEYLRILEQQKRLNQVNYLHILNTLKHSFLELQSRIINDLNLNDESDLIIKATLKTEGLEANCDVLTQVK